MPGECGGEGDTMPEESAQDREALPPCAGAGRARPSWAVILTVAACVLWFFTPTLTASVFHSQAAAAVSGTERQEEGFRLLSPSTHVPMLPR